MSLALLLVPLLSLLAYLTPTYSQTCVSTEVIFSDLTNVNAAFTTQIARSDSLRIDSTGTYLTDTSSNSAGGFFFTSPTDFQGPGGFSVKFVLQSTDTSVGVGDAWEFIVASSTNLDLLPPPYANGEPNAGLSGWSRLNAFVVEFDSHNSGSDEQDTSTNHIAIFLSGTKVCSADVPFSFASGDKYTVWVDYSGFATQAFIRVSDPNDGTRPTSSTLTCDVDIWSTVDIDASNHVGFMAYNPSTGGAEHSLVDLLSVADSYNPRDADTCAIYANCVQKDITDAQCLAELSSSTCLISSCDAGYVWDVSGTDCCAFVEKSTWILSASAGSGPFLDGAVVDCETAQRTIATLTDSSNCA